MSEALTVEGPPPSEEARPAVVQEGGWTPERSAAGSRSPWLIVVIISLATFMEVLDISIANVSLGHIAGALSASYDEATWVLTTYLIANAVAMPLSGWLSKVIGRKRYYLICVALFTVSSFACGIAPNLTVLIIARIAQGLGGGGLGPSEQTIIAETFPPSKRNAALALYGITVIFAPIIGPTVGGFITDISSWRWIFLLSVPVGVLSLFLVNAFIVDPPILETERRARIAGGAKADVPGIALLILCLGCLEFVLDRGEREDWFSSPLITGLAIASVVAALALSIWEWDHPEPVFDVRLLARRNYAIGVIVMLATGGLFFATTQLIPQFLQEVLGYTASEAGKAMTLGGFATLLMMPLAGILPNWVQPKWLILAAMASEAGACFLFLGLSSEVSWGWIEIARTALAFGLPFLFIGVTAAAYVGLPPGKAGDASAQLNLARSLGGSFSISMVQTLLAQRGQAHQAHLVDVIGAQPDRYARWSADLGAVLPGGGALPAQMAHEVGVQAQVLAYVDAFWVLGVAALLMLPLIGLLKRVPAGAHLEAH
jgi:DHA2 family multidrug resistance protein